MHPFEVLIDAGVFVVFAFLFPVHIVALWIWQLTHLTLNVIGHLGYEIYPKGFNSHWLFKFKAPTTHHNMHHEKSNGNYGFYFTWWDRIFNTEFKNYNQVFNAIHERKAKAENGAHLFI
jgi:sterol desaturase/sphingolipid hydroxylase (fatty acid hydroxylase superfamily)